MVCVGAGKVCELYSAGLGQWVLGGALQKKRGFEDGARKSFTGGCGAVGYPVDEGPCHF